jgi:hypothetical protein
MPNAIGETGQLQKQPAAPIIRGHGIHGERSNNNGVGSWGLDNRGAKNGSGEDHNRLGAAGERAGRPGRSLIVAKFARLVTGEGRASWSS